MADAPTIRYIGSASRRVITDKQWKAAGVNGQKTVEWNKSNNFTVPKADLSDEAIAKLDKGFKID